MNSIDGAKILAVRIGDRDAPPKPEVADEASALFHWCGVNPTLDLRPVLSDPLARTSGGRPATNT